MNGQRHDLPPILLLPEGPYRCGDVVTANWTLTNYGDAHAAGGRLRFELTPGLELQAESVTIRGLAAESARAAFEESGALLGELAPGDSLIAEFAFRVAQVSEEQQQSLQATLAWPEGGTYRSPRAPVELRLRPRIEVLPLRIEVSAHEEQCSVIVPIRNSGGRSEAEIVVSLPSLPGTHCTSHATHGDRVEATASLAAYASQEIVFDFALDDVLDVAYLEIDDARVVSPSSGTFYIPPFVLELPSRVSFASSDIFVEPGPSVEAGTIVSIVARICNAGRTPARDVRLSVALPAELTLCPGTISVNGSADGRTASLDDIVLPVVRPHVETIVRFACAVAAPVAHGTPFTIDASIDGEPLRAFSGTIDSQARFPASENFIWMDDSATVAPSEERTIHARICNRGTDASRPVRLRIDAPDLLVQSAVFQTRLGSEPAKIVPILRQGGVPGCAIDLGSIPAQETCSLDITVAAPESFADASAMAFACFVREAAQAEILLGELVLRGRTLPQISSSSYLAAQRRDSFRLGQTRHLSLVVRNDGADVARNVRVTFDMPEGLAIENVHGATLDEGAIRFAEIPARASSEATIALKVRSVAAGESQSEIHAVISGDRVSTVYLPPLPIKTESQSFIDDVRVVSTPIDDDTAIVVKLSFRNIGDGTANRLVVSSSALDGYVLNTTSLNGRTYRDIKGCSPLAYGFALPPLLAGGAVDLQFVVRTKADETYVPAFSIESDAQEPLEVIGDAYRAQLRHRFLPEVLEHVPELPALAQPPERIDDAEYRELPSVAQAREAEPEPQCEPEPEPEPEFVAQLEPEPAAEPHPGPEPVAELEPVPEFDPDEVVSLAVVPWGGPLRFGARSRSQIEGPTSVLRLDEKRIDRAIEATGLLLRTNIGLYRHVFGMRLFVPDRLLNVREESRQAWHRITGALGEDFRVPMLRLVIPDFEPTLGWSELLSHEDLAEEIGTLLKTIPEAILQPEQSAAELADDEIFGEIKMGNFEYVDADEAASIHHLNAVLPDLLPSTVRDNAALSDALSAYKDGLARNFRALVYMGDAQRHERMRKAPTDELDAQLQHVINAVASRVPA